ncbi:MAG TPA: metallophosphoesterase, partial [Bryobacteraceae bacterium]
MLSRRSILALLAGLALPAYAQDSFKDVERIVAIGDIHGDYDQLVSVLRAAEVIDKSNRWVGGKTFLVQTGDLLDRGADAKKVMDLLIDLEPQAKKAGGRVLSLLGNHETMNLYGDLRYVIPEDFETFITGKMKPSPGHPSGWADRKKAFETDGQYGKWMRQKNAIVKINDIVFLHGGISPKYEKTSISTINNEVREELSNFDKLQ